ncbi:response regulator [Rubricoccus marinus]|uniref:DNA-binding response regulator n=1 Tax=Rubricoccus marinus TaxID=716817 RepID=A0A259TV75_9BACT|nr:response regulator transcription factor [Rubricoccus marinus]OZC01448.1 hypothetical protein BSZ36_17375 [Rubricoccus marinus]
MIRVLIADDHPFVRRGVREALNDEGIEVVGEAENGEEALSLSRALALDVAVVDLSMPGLGGLEVVARLRVERPDLPVLVLSAHPSRELGLQVLQAGGVGYVDKNEAPDVLPAAVRRAASGRRVIPADLAEVLAERAEGRREGVLTPREIQVARCLARGESREEASRALGIAPSTVSTYRGRVFSKLGIRTGAELARIAARRGWID